jgi:hypothetical protein
VGELTLAKLLEAKRILDDAESTEPYLAWVAPDGTVVWSGKSEANRVIIDAFRKDK